jgi:hypothetical protein
MDEQSDSYVSWIISPPEGSILDDELRIRIQDDKDNRVFHWRVSFYSGPDVEDESENEDDVVDGICDILEAGSKSGWKPRAPDGIPVPKSHIEELRALAMGTPQRKLNKNLN